MALTIRLNLDTPGNPVIDVTEVNGQFVVSRLVNADFFLGDVSKEAARLEIYSLGHTQENLETLDTPTLHAATVDQTRSLLALLIIELPQDRNWLEARGRITFRMASRANKPFLDCHIFTLRVMASET